MLTVLLLPSFLLSFPFDSLPTPLATGARTAILTNVYLF